MSGKTRRSRAERRRAAQEREDATHPLLRGQTQPEMRDKLIQMSKSLREKYGPRCLQCQQPDHPGACAPTERNPDE